MKSTEDIRNFLNAFVDWAAVQGDVHAIALVGSYARGAARDDSDIDLVLLTDQPQKYLEELKWIESFGRLEKRQTEDYGKLTSVRVWYRDGVEVEYGITTKFAPNRLYCLFGGRTKQLNLSAWAYHRILKLARTIADIAECEEIQSVHLAEALQYRSK